METLKPAHMSWPFNPRRTRRILPDEARQIKVLLAHVEAGNMDIDAIAAAYAVNKQTILRIKNKRTYRNIGPSRRLKFPQKRKA